MARRRGERAIGRRGNRRPCALDAALARIQNDLSTVEADPCLAEKGTAVRGYRHRGDVQWLEQESTASMRTGA